MVLLIYIQLLILLIWFSFVFVYWKSILFLVLPINQFAYPFFLFFFLRAFLAALNFMARKIFSYVACLASLLNCIIIYIFIYEHFFLANNKIYKLICVIWAIILSWIDVINCISNFRDYCYVIIMYSSVFNQVRRRKVLYFSSCEESHDASFF
jgi:hypothetical protein